MTRQLERRFTPSDVEIREHGGKATIEGHAAVFDKLSQDLGGFVEKVNSGAFNKTIKESDVRALYNHDENFVLGRNKSGTLDLSVDSSGLYYRINPPDTTYARDLMAVMERGDVSHSSFAFYTILDEWDTTEQNYPQRSLVEVSLVDVSPVTYPAYLDSDSGLGRSASLVGLARRANVPVESLVDVAMIQRAISGAPFEEPGETHSDEQKATRWARRLQFMKDLERATAAE